MQVPPFAPVYSGVKPRTLSLTTPTISASPRFSKSADADERGARALVAFFSAVFGGIVLAGLGIGKFWHSNSHFSVGSSLLALQNSVNTFQSAKTLPSQGKVEFRAMLERMQEQVVANKTSPSTEQIKTLVPDLTPGETKALEHLIVQSGNITQAQDLMPLFTPWLEILDNHSTQKLDKAKITADAEQYFASLKGHINTQRAFLIALIAAAGLTTLGVGQAFRK